MVVLSGVWVMDGFPKARKIIIDRMNDRVRSELEARNRNTGSRAKTTLSWFSTLYSNFRNSLF